MAVKSLDEQGVRTRRRFALTFLGIALVILAPLAVILVREALIHHAVAARSARAFTRDLTVDGPPCPTLSAEQYGAQPLRATQVFSFDMIRFGRRFGHAECGVAGMHGSDDRGERDVCQFTGPGVLELKTGKGVFYFAPGVGQPATVAVRDGRPTCVMASKFGFSAAN